MTQREITNGDILQALVVVPIFYLPSWAHPIDADVLDVLLQSRVSPVSDVYCYYSYLS